MSEFPDDQQRVWIELERDEGRVQAVFDFPTKTFTPDGERALHANEIVSWWPVTV